MIRLKIIFVIILTVIACSEVDEFRDTCNPAYVFNESVRPNVNYSLVAEQIFDPYCSPCHSTQTYQTNPQRRVGYVPFDSAVPLRLASDFSFKTSLARYINFTNPRDSKLIQMLSEAGISRAPDAGIVQYREPRFNCRLPDDYVDALVWWIQNARGSIDALVQ